MTITDDIIPPVIWGHPAHPEHHTLKLVNTDDRPFTCDGCLEPGHGAGTRYRCEHERCKFDLHACCARPAPALQHPMFGDTTFMFLLAPPDTNARGGGRACGDCVRGFVYHSIDEDLDLHPCCACLPEHLLQEDRHVFELRRKSSPQPCGMCGASSGRGTAPTSTARTWT